ncbi:MAG: NUDIX domain-containing protein [Oscillospiraceae bacterium]|nr:NUDIX domain-containing protein [Oscillospiraceae bacterium]
MLVSVDCIILGFQDKEINVLIVKRKFNPLKGGRSLMGGFVRKDESLNEAVARVVAGYTGVENVYMEQVGAYGEVNRDPGGRVVSVVYYALIDMHQFDEQLKDRHNTEWVNVKNVGPLILDHRQFLDDALRHLRIQSATHPVGFNLLPEQFTLPQLQSLYEAIYAHELDKRNFRKKVLDMGVLEKLDKKDKSSSKRGAFYYKFNKEKYDYMVKNGVDISFI